ncbi:phosphopantothenoylcysteine decarboxylase [Verrucomicrobium sp. BvORR106]|uniref:phosphopantothenoylcysteine decarboxylase domain-containing protein n=1 Tax=Verrucomicrobium sp. BvORR106 TaxID=1403819 RepID=UPI000571832B|nr:phosphopantothenoylcysteine decarboxylase [Verrucomicrobium sp. BvORR106]
MKILITAGPTREPLDPVRYLTNRSSGRMGYALAEAAVAEGHLVDLVSGPVSLIPTDGVKMHFVETAQQMWEKVRQLTLGEPPPQLAIHAAAVADYRPKVVAEQKIKKQADTLILELERNPDVLGSMRGAFGFTGYLVGFAAETQNLVANAQEKLKRKGCDLVIANDVSRKDTGFDSTENEVMLCLPSGETELIPKQSKQTLAREIIRRVVALASQ